MKNWMRIFFVGFVLVGGVAFFGYWSIGQFDQIFGDLSASYFANTYSPNQSFNRPNREPTTTTQDISADIATSTDVELAPTSTSTVSELFFALQKSDTEVYIGCTYPISWQSGTTVSSLEATLIDAGTREVSGPIASGLAREYEIQPDSQSVEWKVGVVWPGEYFILISRINGIEKETKSEYFMVRKMPEGISADEKEKICKESGGFF